MAKTKKITKRKFEVTICRTAYAFRDIVVEATSRAEAQNLAMEESGNHEFSEKDADYSVQGTREIKKS